jgi:hypothetical protein
MFNCLFQFFKAIRVSRFITRLSIKIIDTLCRHQEKILRAKIYPMENSDHHDVILGDCCKEAYLNSEKPGSDISIDDITVDA